MKGVPMIVPCLWFDRNAEEAIRFYVDVFNASPRKGRDSKIISISRYESGLQAPGAGQMQGQVLTAIFELNGQRYMALDGGPLFRFNEAISFSVECHDQAEVDYFWNALSADPQAEACGWLRDRFGLSWQIVPRKLAELFSSPDRRKSLAAANAMLQMKKLILADLQAAFDQA